MGEIKRNLFFSFSAHGIQLIQSLIWTLFVPKLLGVEQFGYWQLFIFFTQYGGFLTLGLLDGIYLEEGGKRYAELNYTRIGTKLKLFCLWQMIVLMCVCLFGCMHTTSERCFVIIASCTFIFISNILNFYMYILQAVNEIKTVASGRMYTSAFFALSIILLLCYQCKDFQLYIVTYTVCTVFCQIYYMIKIPELTKYLFKCVYENCTAEIWSNIKLGIVLMLANISGMLIIGFGRYLVDCSWGIKAFSIVSFSFTFVNFFMAFISQASLVLFPELKRWETSKLVSFYFRMQKTLSEVLPLLLVTYGPICWLVSMWLPKYTESLHYLVYLLPLCIFDAKMNLLSITLFKVYKEVSKLLICNILTLGISALCVMVSIYCLESLETVVCSMLFAVYFRSVIAEKMLSKILGKRVDKNEQFIEIGLILSFVILNLTIGVLWSFIIYLTISLVRFYFIRKSLRMAR